MLTHLLGFANILFVFDPATLIIFSYASSSTLYPFECQCIMAQALKKFGIKDFCQNDDLGSHFLEAELFQIEIFGCYLICNFTFNLYLGTS